MSTSPVKVAMLGSATVLVFDILASLASRQFGFVYARASFGSYLIYLAIGFCAARASSSNAIGVAAVAAGLAGLVDASLGWAISWALGPGRLPPGMQLTAVRWIGTAVFVVALAAVVGAAGGVAGRRSGPVVAADPPRS